MSSALEKFVHDLVGLHNRGIAAAESQLEEEEHDPGFTPEAAEQVRSVEAAMREMRAQLNALLGSRSGPAGDLGGMFKDALGVTMGLAAGVAGHASRYPGIRILRDQFLVLAHLSFTYSIVYTVALGGGYDPLARLCEDHLDTVGALMRETYAMAPAAAAAALAAGGELQAPPDTVQAARERGAASWRNAGS